MKNPFFEPIDFKMDGMQTVSFVTASQIANEKLNALIESWPTVYGSHQDGEWNSCATLRTSDDTHTAKLAFIEELPKKECDHEPSRALEIRDPHPIYRCKHCGVQLFASWSTK